MTRFIALIPARGGSVGIPRKNLRLLRGKPLVSYTIAAAKASRHISDVYLSSEDDEILKVGAASGCLPIRRPDRFAQASSTAVEVVQHFLGEIQGKLADEDVALAYLQPTSPLRTAVHLDEAIQAMKDNACMATVSVVELKKSPYKSFTVSEAGRLQSLFDEKLSNKNRQDLPVTYISNGAIYAFRISDFMEKSGFPSNGSLPYIMSEADSVDIDSEDDLKIAEQILARADG